MATDTGTDHGSTIIRALEGAWDAIRRHHPDLPGVVMVTGHGRTPGDDAVTWGHHWPGRWTAADGSAVRPELFAGGELLALGSRRIMQTLLHEAAHALATVRGIKDTSTGGRYHNREFAKLASALGLQPPARPDEQRRGFSNCSITDETITRYAKAISALDSTVGHRIEDPVARLIASQASLPEETLPPVVELRPGAIGTDLPARPEPARRTTVPRTGRRLAVVCRCASHQVRDAHGGSRTVEGPRRIQATPGLLDGGPVLCGVCNAAFEPEN
ncbi:hypothetical protein GCM10009663_57200 [Kitasatospora arboriphila]|uniref:SprT-like domain-containing protein n=2 Tax=Kitasatospora arboriphila TaxID=258052 RepID=A0ABN1TY62_9ACTN